MIGAVDAGAAGWAIVVGFVVLVAFLWAIGAIRFHVSVKFGKGDE